MANRSTKKSVAYRLHPSAVELLKALSEKNDVSQAVMLETLIRDRAKRAGVRVALVDEEEWTRAASQMAPVYAASIEARDELTSFSTTGGAYVPTPAPVEGTSLGEGGAA